MIGQGGLQLRAGALRRSHATTSTARGGSLMFDSARDLALYAAAGAAGGLIYWAAREHGQIFSSLLRQLLSRR